MAQWWAWKDTWSLSRAQHSCWQLGSRRFLHFPLENSALTLVTTRWYLIVMGHWLLLSHFLLGFGKYFYSFSENLTALQYILWGKNPKHTSWRCPLLCVAATASWRTCALSKPSTKKGSKPPAFLTSKVYNCCKDAQEDKWKRESAITCSLWLL